MFLKTDVFSIKCCIFDACFFNVDTSIPMSSICVQFSLHDR